MSDFPSMNMMRQLWLTPEPWANPDQAAKDFDNFIRKVQADAWDVGHGTPCDKYVRDEMCRDFHRNPYRD